MGSGSAGRATRSAVLGCVAALALSAAQVGCATWRGAVSEDGSTTPPRTERARPFRPGERLVFRARVAGVDAARATLSVGAPLDEEGGPVLPLRITVEGYRWLTRFYPLRIKLVSIVDQYDLQPRRMDRSGSNGSVARTVSLEFQPKQRVRVSVQLEGKKRRTYRRRTLPRAFDPVSGLYEIRAWLLTGEPERELVVFDGGWTRTLRVTRGPVEEVWTPAGWFKARRFEVEARKVVVPGDGKHRKPPAKHAVERFSAWVTDDEHLVPVRLLGQTPVGPAEVLLESRGHRAPDAQPPEPSAGEEAEGPRAGAEPASHQTP